MPATLNKAGEGAAGSEARSSGTTVMRSKSDAASRRNNRTAVAQSTFYVGLTPTSGDLGFKVFSPRLLAFYLPVFFLLLLFVHLCCHVLNFLFIWTLPFMFILRIAFVFILFLHFCNLLLVLSRIHLLIC